MIKSKLQKKKRNPGWDLNQLSTNNNIAQEQQIKQTNVIKSLPLSQLSKKYYVQINKELGKGFASVVYEGINIITKNRVCIKAIDLLCLGQSMYQFLKNQIHFLRLLNSQYIVKLYDVYQSSSFYYLVMELCQFGDLFKQLMFLQHIDQQTILNIIYKISLGISYLQNNHILHRDLKTQNIFISSNNQIKIGDLGFSCSSQNPDKINVGSPIYMSPQVAESQQYSFQSDIYSLGVIWYELISNDSPWKAASEVQLFEKKKIQEIKIERDDISQQHKQIVKRCLSCNPQFRPSINQILDFTKSE